MVVFTYPGDKWVREGTQERCRDEECEMSHPSPVIVCQLELQEAKGWMQEIMRLGHGYVDSFNNGVREHAGSDSFFIPFRPESNSTKLTLLQY